MELTDASVPAVAFKLTPEHLDHAVLGVLRTLGRLGVPTYAVQDSATVPAARSRYATRVFTIGGREPLDLLADIGRTLGERAVLIATDDPSADAVAEHADELRQWFSFPAVAANVTRTLSNKQTLYELCRQGGIAAPETAFPRSRPDVVAYCDGGRFPAMLKAIDTWAVQRRTGIRMVRCDDAASLLAEYDRLEDPAAPSLMIQEYIPGGSDSVWMLDGYFDDASECVFAVTGRKLRQYPPYTGWTSLGVCEWNEAVVETTRRLAREVGYVGPIDIGYRYDERDGAYKLLDVNPRVGASFRLFAGTNGMDVVRAMYLHLTGQAVPAAGARDGRKWLVEPLDAISSRRYWLDGHLTLSGWVRSYRGVEEAAWFARDDFSPFASMVVHSLRTHLPRAVRKAWRRSEPAVGRT
jgi:predicted ATP-grasp superfamily ATP-dependent carboligase